VAPWASRTWLSPRQPPNDAPFVVSTACPLFPTSSSSFLTASTHTHALLTYFMQHIYIIRKRLISRIRICKNIYDYQMFLRSRSPGIPGFPGNRSRLTGRLIHVASPGPPARGSHLGNLRMTRPSSSHTASSLFPTASTPTHALLTYFMQHIYIIRKRLISRIRI
jgi:hypothetical protein